MQSRPPRTVFATDEAYAFGMTQSGLRNSVRRGGVLRPRRGIYAETGIAFRSLGDAIAVAAHPELPLSHTSAARALHVPLVGCPLRTEMTVPPRTNADLPGVHPFRARLRPHEVVTMDAASVTSPARTVIDIARHYSLLTSVPAIDFVLHERLATAEELRDVLEFCQRWPGSRRARRALHLCDSRSESPLESISRLAIVKLGLPAPEPQVVILDRDGYELARVDFYWERFGAVGEADGAGKYDDDISGVIQREKDREESLDAVRLALTRWDWDLVWRRRPELARKIGRAFQRGLDRDRSGQARLWTPRSTERVSVL